MSQKKTILIVCNDNTLYSKLAEAYFKKYAGHWKNIFSAGLNIRDKLASPYLKTLLGPDKLDSTIDLTLRSVEGYDIHSFDYIIALTENAYQFLKANFPEKETVFIDLSTFQSNNVESLKKNTEDIKTEFLKFIKSGPIKRWSELD